MSDFSGISRLREEQEKTLKNCELMIEKWEKFKQDYETVDKLLNDLPKKTAHEIMVPVGSLAYMPGNLIHTNEIMVLLGDNWFAERSASQAVDIAKRRLRSVEEYLCSLHKEHENILSHMAFTNDVVSARTQNDFQEIKEELTEKDLRRQDAKTKRVAHAKATKTSVKKVKLTKKSQNIQVKPLEDEKLFARLEELERQEQVNKELENEQYFEESIASNTNNNKSSMHAENEAHTSLINATCQEEDRTLLAETCGSVQQEKHATNTCSTDNEKNNGFCGAKANDSRETHLAKKVKWKETIVEVQSEQKVSNEKDGKATTIYFRHSNYTAVKPMKSQEEKHITSPAEILTDYLKRKETTKKHEGNDEISTTKDENEETMTAAFTEIVVEHKDVSSGNTTIESDKEQKPATRKISKFKASRMK